jgi:hypothetical protein
MTACYSRGKEEDVIKISPFRIEQSAFLQLYIPNKSQSCLITEMIGVSEIDESREVAESLNLLVRRTNESVNFVNMDSIIFLNISVVSDTAFIEYEFQENTELTEMEEALLLYAIINTASIPQEIDFVKLNNNSGSKYFFEHYNIEVPLAPSNALLYKDYVSPIKTVKGLFEAIIDGRALTTLEDIEINNIIQNLTFQIKRYNILNYEYNKYGDFTTVKARIVFMDEIYNSRTLELSFLLELTGGRFNIKEIIEH